MKARILFLAAALTLAALPVRAQTELQELVAAALEVRAAALEVEGQEFLAEGRRKEALQARRDTFFAWMLAADYWYARRVGEEEVRAWRAVARAWESVPAESKRVKMRRGVWRAYRVQA